MITTDPARRAELLGLAQRLALAGASEEDRPLMQALVPAVMDQVPDSLAFRLSAETLAARMAEYLRFVAHTMPPEVQLYKGLPGLHVSVRNPDPAVDAAVHADDGRAHEVTIVETHTPDAPFIFESLKNFFQNEGLRVFSAIHPRLTVRRQWERVVYVGPHGEDGSQELFCQFRIERIDRPDRMRRLEHQMFSLLKSVFLAVDDFKPMAAAVRQAGTRLRARGGDAPAEVESAQRFLDWLLDDNFVMLGVMRYAMAADGVLRPQQESALGAFEDPSLLPTVFPGLPDDIERNLAPSEADTRIIDIDYCVRGRAIHHLEPLEDLFIREWNADGSLAAMTLVIGRFAKSAFASKAQEVPLLQEKLAFILETSGLSKNSHAYREARAIFNHFPKRELFYATAADLKAIIEQMVHMVGDDEIAATVREGSGYAAASVAFSDIRYSFKAGDDLRRLLGEAFGTILFSEWADCGTKAAIIYYLDASQLEAPLDVDTVRALTSQAIATWEDLVAEQLDDAFGTIEGRRLFNKYVRHESRSGLYRESTAPAEVPEDLRHLERLEGRLEMSVLPESGDAVTIKLYAPKPLGLTQTLRTLQNLSLPVVEELSLPLILPEGRTGFMERLRINAPKRVVSAVVDAPDRLLDALRALHEGRATDDALNGLVTLEGLTWRQVEVLRTLRNHLLQLRTNYNAETMTAVMLRNSAASAALFRLFAARFDPAQQDERDAAVDRADADLRRALQQVESLLDDEVLRGIENLIEAIVRTNVYQKPERPVISIKVECAKVAGMVSPRPLYEIYVHSPYLEGIHLRGGKVARGGIRWSDRYDDFRTEVLGLMKTQMAKNAIIVPVGSKGGFVLKGNLPARPALDQYLIDRYRQFVAGLLDITDNIVDGTVVHPPDVVRFDEDDPYLVVAADKGTAHLSDTANAVSAQYGFWLGDAFASGGSQGYDHKKEGITARGAWECVKHHFQNLGHDVQTQPFTMVGIGDMSGDVFGNGLLQSRVTKLVGAFNHQHIFVDPNPDTERSYEERQRLFVLPRSSWRDYDASCISQGGGVFDRSAKSIPVSPEMQALFGIDTAEVTGEEMIRRMLTSAVDLLYNGGIGTYIKASTEDDAEVGDRANDRVRVDASDVQARVIGEGGNLGMTQRGRLEYWGRGGLCNTDAIDNSGGVDMSDHEVNIKILMDLLVAQKVIESREARNVILEEMTDNVSELVLEDNRQQARCLTLDGLRSRDRYDEFVDLIDHLVAARAFNREDEDAPTRDALLTSPTRERGLPRPLLAVLLAHSKLLAYDETLASSFPDSPDAERFLHAYFPRLLQERFGAHLSMHPLRREIVATGAVNQVINQAGITFIPRMATATGAGTGEIVAAYVAADHARGGAAERTALLSSGRPVTEVHAALLALEDGVEEEVRRTLGAQGHPSGGKQGRPSTREKRP
jgi:glutamate dehydrogenase